MAQFSYEFSVKWRETLFQEVFLINLITKTTMNI